MLIVLKSLEAILDTVYQRRAYLAELLLQHYVLSLLAIIITVIIGIGAGIAILKYRSIRQIVMGIVNFIYTIPSIAMFGIFIPLVGIGFENALIVLVIYGLLPMIRSTYTGLSEVDPNLTDAAKAMGATPSQIFFRIKWPLAFPAILSGFRTMVVMTIALAGLASFIGAGGLGQAIYRGINTNNSALILTGSIAVALLALIIDMIIGFFENLIRKRKIHSGQFRKVAVICLLLLSVMPLLFMVFKGENKRAPAEDEIVVASKPTSEQYILGEIISKLIESNTNLHVRRVFGIGGGTSNIQPGMLSGEIDIYPEYTGTAWIFVLKKGKIADPDSLYALLENLYPDKYSLSWVTRFGFNNTYTIALPDSTARKEDIEEISDLSSKSDRFVFGAEFDFFEREDGFKGLASLYSLKFKKLVELDINLKFKALKNKTVDVIDAFSTDPRIRQMNLRTLKDDRKYFPVYQAGIVAREESLEKHPELSLVLKKLKNTIDDSTMTMLNYQVEILNRIPEKVADEFLKSKGLIGQP